MAERATLATIHWMRFPSVETPEALNLSTTPKGSASWKIGPDGPLGSDGYRLPSNIWCGVALYRSRREADSALDNPSAFLPFLDRSLESWHALLAPIAHRGACNHLESATPGTLFDIGDDDPGGALVVMTTAGFNLAPGYDVNRLVDFRRNVDRVRGTVASAPGNLAHQVFTPHTYGDDGVTMTVWRDEIAMSNFAYRPGPHKAQVDRYKVEHTADRTSFTRFRALRTTGQWEGGDPIEAVRE